MAKLGKYFQKVFGLTDLAANGVGQFGSLAAGSPAFASNPAEVQTTQFSEGWSEAVIGQNYPPIEDENALAYLFSYQLAYLMQSGVAEWDATTVYFYGSIINVAGVLYSCINDNSGVGISNENPTSTTGFWSPAVPSVGNSLLNAAFDSWQRGTSIVAPYNATPAFTYGPDRWAAWNAMSASGVITLSQVAGSLPGSVFGLSAKVSTASGTPGAIGAQVVQVLDSIDALPYYGNLGVFSVNVKSTGNVTAVKLQFFALNSTTGVATNILGGLIGSPVTTTVNSSGFIKCQIPAQAMGTTMGTAGVVGVLITASGVSSGHVSDLNNGFVLEQGMMNSGGVLNSFKRQFTSESAEKQALQAYARKSFDWNTAPADFGTTSFNSAVTWIAVTTTASTSGFGYAQFGTPMRIAPIATCYSAAPTSGTGVAGEIHNFDNGSNYIPSASQVSTTGFVFKISSGTVAAGNQLGFNYFCDAEIY